MNYGQWGFVIYPGGLSIAFDSLNERNLDFRSNSEIQFDKIPA
jgi:hypothetical protein